MKQPFAELVMQGKKKIELRKWNTNFRGKFLIHASKIPDEKEMEKFGFKGLPCGCILGKAELIDVKKYRGDKEHKRDKNLHLADAVFGNYGFILKNPKRFKKPIPCRGNLGFWEFNLK